MSDEHEVERTLSRDDAAAVFRQLADGIGTGSVRVDAEGGPVVVDVPEEVDLEVEVEVDEETELEVELGLGDADVRSAETSAGTAGEDHADAAASEEEGTEPAETVASEAPDADDERAVETVVGPADGRGDGATFELFEDRAGEWRWRLVHRNGNVIADSGEGYARKGSAKKGLRSVARNAPGASVVEESE